MAADRGETERFRQAFINLQALLDTLLGITARWDLATELHEGYAANIAAVYRIVEDIPRELEAIYDLQLHILEQLTNSRSTRKVTGSLRSQMLERRIESLLKQIGQRQTNLNILEEQSTIYGIEVPLHVTTGIIIEKEAIERLENELAERRDLLAKIDKA